METKTLRNEIMNLMFQSSKWNQSKSSSWGNIDLNKIFSNRHCKNVSCSAVSSSLSVRVFPIIVASQLYLQMSQMFRITMMGELSMALRWSHLAKIQNLHRRPLGHASLLPLASEHQGRDWRALLRGLHPLSKLDPDSGSLCKDCLHRFDTSNFRTFLFL